MGKEHSPLIEIDASRMVSAVAFTANGEYLVGGGQEIRAWRVENNKQLPATTLEACNISCLSVSKDGRWIAAGTISEVIIWDAKTGKKTMTHGEGFSCVTGVDFSPDGTRLVVASFNCTAAIWDIATLERMLTLRHEQWVRAAKYSAQGDRIATATYDHVRVWDKEGHLLIDIPVIVTPRFNTGLVWFNDHLFVVSDSTIMKFEASTGSTVSEWAVPDTNRFSCIALPQNGDFIAYSTIRTVTFWDASTHSQLGLIHHPHDIVSIAISPDDRLLAISGEKKIAIKSLSHHCEYPLPLDYT